MDFDLDVTLANSTIPLDDVLKRVRRCQTHEINQTRHIDGEYHTLFSLLEKYPTRFQEYARMRLDTFEYILSECEEHLEKKWCNLHQPIHPEEQLVLTIRFLASGSSYKVLAFRFRMGESTVATTVKKVMTVLWEVLQPSFMPVPSEQQLQEISNDFFEGWQFPHCQGAINCRHVAIIQPAHSKTLFCNWKKFYSIKIQAVVDANYKFIFIEVGDFGSSHDSTTFKKSKLFECLTAGTFKFLQDGKLPNPGIILPHFLIGDGEYMLQEHLRKPYRGKNLPLEHEMYNKRLSRARMVVECAFGHVYQMWEIFHKTMSYTPEIASLITKCACILRNLIIEKERKKNHVSQPAANILNLASSFVGDYESDRGFVVGCGKEVREELTKYFMANPIDI